MIADYKFSGKEPLRETVLNACNEKPKLLERKKIFDRVVSQLLDIINKFDEALGAFEEVLAYGRAIRQADHPPTEKQVEL